MVKQISHSL
jgi:hypothetical protein